MFAWRAGTLIVPDQLECETPCERPARPDRPWSWPVIRRHVALVLLMPLLLHLSGCTTTRCLRMPGAVADPAGCETGDEVFTGQDVVIHLLDGSKINGTVKSITPTAITLVRGGNFGRETSEISVESIDRIEHRGLTRFSNAVLVIGTAAVFVFVAGVAVLAASIDGGGMS